MGGAITEGEVRESGEMREVFVLVFVFVYLFLCLDLYFVWVELLLRERLERVERGGTYLYFLSLFISFCLWICILCGWSYY